jgi:HPt (histidine-containing phosphotransfer) domain-containing protein
MVIKLNKDTMSDELYNELLMAFVQSAVDQGLEVNSNSKFEDWNITCEFVAKAH